MVPLRAPAVQLQGGPIPASRGASGRKILPAAHDDSIRALIPVAHQAQHMVPWATLLGFLLVGQSLASSSTTMSVKGRPVTDPRNDIALEYVGALTLPFVMIST